VPYLRFVFKTDAFGDPPHILARNVNRIGGHALATWLAAALRARAADVSEVWAEDHGWDFSVSHAGATYLCACSLEGEAPAEGNVTLGKSRSLPDRLLGRNRLEQGDAVAGAIRDALAVAPEIRDLSEHKTG